MASNSGGHLWSAAVRPLLAASYSSFNKNEIPEFAKCIWNSEDQIVDSAEEYESFYSSLVALASHYLAASASSVSKSSLSVVTSASRVLLRYLLARLQSVKPSSLAQKTVMMCIQGLCIGEGSLSKSDIVTLVALLKLPQLPPNIMAESSAAESEDVPPKQKRPRLDTGNNIFDQLTSVFNDAQSLPRVSMETQTESAAKDGDTTVMQVTEPGDEMKQIFAMRNCSALISLGGTDILIDTCQKLPFLRRHIEECQQALSGRPLVVPKTLSEALTARNSFQTVLTDVCVVWRAFSLPVLEPLTPDRLDQIVRIMLGCLHAAVSAATANTIVNLTSPNPLKTPGAPKDEETDTMGGSIVEKALKIFASVVTSVKKSTRAGGNHLQNINMMACWLLLKGLQKIASVNPSAVLERTRESRPKSQDKSRDPPSPKLASAKSFQGFGVLAVALASHCVQLLSVLLADVQVEGAHSQVSTGDSHTVKLCVNNENTASQRVQKLTTDINLTDLLLNLVLISFRKATLLHRLKQGSETSESSATSSDSNTYYEDDFSSSEDSSEEDEEDCEPLLGWLTQTLDPGDTIQAPTPPPPPPVLDEGGGASGGKRQRQVTDGESSTFIPDKREPEGFVSLGADVLSFVQAHLISSSLPVIHNLIRSALSADHMTCLGLVIRELDKECSRPGAEKVFDDLSVSLSKFSHSLIAAQILSENLQDSLLSQLGVSPVNVDPWPMTVYPRTLAVLAEITLLKQQREREKKVIKSQSEAAIISIWVRFLTSLKTAVINFDNRSEFLEDLNVEHLQLLVFFFHSLPLKQKKQLLLQLSQSIIAVADIEPRKLENTVPLPLSRLLLVFDYLLRNFYDPPAALLEQVQYNLFSIHTAPLTGEATEAGKESLFFPCRPVEDNFREYLTPKESSEVGSFTPRFYNIGPTEINTQEAPKIDGLASSFLMSTSDSLDYDALYLSVINLSLAGSSCDKSKEKLTLLDSSAMHYHSLTCHRLLASLPPSVQYMRMLESGTVQMSHSCLLHTLRWTPRIAHKTFSGWAKDCLVKQGQTTQQADALITAVSKQTNNVKYEVRLTMHFLMDQIAVLPLVNQNVVLAQRELPGAATIATLDAVISKVHVSLDEAFAKAMEETDPYTSMAVAADLLPATFMLIEAYSLFIRSSLLSQVAAVGGDSPTADQLKAYGTVVSIGSSCPSVVSVLGLLLMSSLPLPVRNVLDKWNNSGVASDFPAVGSWHSTCANDILPCESYLNAIHNAHLNTLSGQSVFTVNASLRHCLNTLVRFAADLATWCPDHDSGKDMVRVAFPMVFDATTDYLEDTIFPFLERIVGAATGEVFSLKMYVHVISTCHDLITSYSAANSGLDEKIFLDCLKFMENNLEKPVGKKAFEKFYTENGDLSSILLSAAGDNLSSNYGTKVLKFFNKLFQLAEKNPADKSYAVLCGTLTRLVCVDQLVLECWLKKMIMAPIQGLDDAGGKVQENRFLLQSLTSYMVKENSHVGEEVSQAILKTLIPMGAGLLASIADGSGFAELMVVMHTLAGAGKGRGHQSLFEAATSWLDICKSSLSENVTAGTVQEDPKHQAMFEAVCYLLSYIGEILSAIKHLSERGGATSPPLECELTTTQETDSDWADDLGPDEDDSAAEDSDEESLNSKLCTFTITQKEFMNQHWYHCHTCKMVDGVGVCTICAKVCHKDHDLTYAKFGSFFCDCGAKEDGTCMALVKRSSQSCLTSSGHGATPSPFSMATVLPSSLRRRLSSPLPTDKANDNKSSEQASRAREMLGKQIEPFRDALLKHMEKCNTVQVVLDLLQTILPSVLESYHKDSPMGATARAQKALTDLHSLPKTIETTDQLMTVTLGSQEGAFENVRMNYSGDQGQTIRQLIIAHMLRRVAMCVLASPHGKRQHLAVSHEKGKLTILQLSALLKQADSSKKKLTLTRLASAPIPFTVLSITGNPCNEDFLAVCGLKDCHVLTFTSSGSVANHMVLQPALTTGNFIIKTIWLPGSQTELAIVTADFVKIYDLGVDAISPQYFFLLPTGKVRDATFLFSEEGRSLILMSSTGYIYAQPMEEASSAQHGPFYITNVLEVSHADLKDSNGQVAGGGVSVHYSHTLQLLFFSFFQGKSYVATVTKDLSSCSSLFPLVFKSSNGASKGSNSGTQPLVQWSEVSGHPGLVYCMTQATNNPVVLMIRPDTISIQEVKVIPAKAKIQDVVAIRHVASNSDQQQRTTMIVLCEDGSLRIYMANVDKTGFWLSPLLQPQSAIQVLKPARKKKVSKSGRQPGDVSFPMDFFEHCQHTNDVEYGGNDVLQVYNTQQIKHRLNATGMYIANTKPAGFTLEVTNTSSSTVMMGVRVLVGSQTLERVPSYLEVFNRTTQVNVSRARWYDLPFTREESLTADKKFSLFIGASVDPAGVTLIDSIKVYVKSKESFGWPEETEEFTENAVTPGVKGPVTGPLQPTDTDSSSLTPLPLTSTDRLLASALEVLDGAFASGPPDDKSSSGQTALEVSTNLLTLPTPLSVQTHTKSLLSSLHPSKMAYHNHKDQAQLSHVLSLLSEDGGPLDVEAFQRLIVTARSVAFSRPGNLVRFTDKTSTTALTDATIGESRPTLSKDSKGVASPGKPMEDQHFISRLMAAFWRLHEVKPANPMLAPVCLPGLGHMEATVGAMVEVIHAFTVCDLDYVPLATKHYINLLVSPDPLVSFSAKQALIRALRPCHRRRRVFIPSPPRCSSLGGAGDDDDDVDDRGDKSLSDFSSSLVAPPMGVESLESPGDLLQVEADQDSDQYEVVPMVLEPTDQNPQGNPIPLEELLNAGGNFPPMVDIPPDADDETMVELAIALSLQDQSGNNGGPLSLQDLAMASQGQGSLLFPNSQSAASFEGGHLSDTTASAPGSDDEIGSNAATDGSTLRTSPAEQAGSAGSESGGSVVDSVSVSGRSSVYGDTAHESATTGARSETSSVGVPSSGLQPEGEGSEGDTDQDTTYRLHSLRLLMLERFLEYLPGMKEVGGVRAIPFLQVVLMLTSDLDGDEEKDKAALDNLLTQILQQLHINAKDVTAVAERSPQHEVKLVLLRFLSVLLSRTKAGSKPSNEISSFLSKHTTGALVTTGLVDYCLHILKHLLSYWKQCPATEDEASVTSPLLKAHPMTPPPDMSPFFLRQYVKGHAADVFEDYPQLLTEMALRLPYQMKKISDSAASIPNTVFDQIWFNILSEYMMTQQTPFVKRQVRKLLLFICGTKEKYRQLRDLHGLENHIKAVIDMCAKIGLDQTTTLPAITLPYDTLLTLIEHLKACAEIASTRAINWQMFCHKDQAVLPFLIRASIALDEGVAPVLLQLLQCALCGGAGKFVEQPTGSTSSPSKQKKSRDSEKETPRDVEDGTQKSDDTMCVSLVQRLNKTLDRHLMTRFIRSFLLESNSTNIRWQGQSLILNIHRNSGSQQQETLLDLMWELWPELPQHGRKAAQFVDLLGYFMLKTQDSSEKKTKEYLEKAVKLLEQENLVLTNHPNATIYNMLQGLVDFGGYYLESDPCLVCNNPEIPYANLKLSAIKDDSKFTTTTQIVKLIGSHVISKISARVSDLKRTKMVRVINIYYNNRTVQGVVELKNRPGLWHKAKKVMLTAGQTDVRVEFPIPIVACNLMIEYADFYDNVQATSETLQCPRCSASVPANPGVCGNCGENVFQCHKCRSINYDEKDPFLCNSCGFCKYAKFDFTLTAKPCCAVDPIENEDDRKKAISSINSLLEKADKIYKQLQMHRPALETLMVQVTESGCERAAEDVGGSVAGSSVNRGIQFLAQKYCVEAKSSYAELSKIIQKVLACRKELVDYDRQQQKAAAGAAMMRSVSVEEANVTEVTAKPKVKDIEQSPLKPSNCYGCASAVVEHCITMLRALASNFNIRQILCGQGMIQELIDYNLRRGTLQVRSEVRSLLCLLTQDNRRATEDMNRLLMTRIAAAIKSHLSNPDLGTAVRHEMFLLAESVQKEDSCWEQRVRSVVRLFLLGVELRSPIVMDSITLPCLRILQHLVQPDAGKKNKDKVTEIVGRNLKCLAGDLHVSGEKWLQGDPKHSFAAWRQKLPGKGVEPVAMPTVTPSTPTPVAQKSKADERKETREKYLQEKYGYRWIHKMWKDPGVPVKLTKSSWLRQALFSPSSRSARQTACSIIEAICSVTVRKQEIVNLLTSYLDDIGKSGECAAEYLALFKRLISPIHWKYYLVLRGILLHLGHLITQEVEHLQKLEETTLNSDLAQGFALKALTGLLATFVEQENIKQHYKNKLVGYVLNGYLSLRKLVVQRTKLIDETQDKLLELLEELTTGTDSETREFMSVCIETVQKYPLDDYRSPVFIFERLCSIIYPEENDVSEFFLILEKDPQQEDFLQGRMLGNPYSSSEPSLGPLMRDVKNKICHDCELVALLEDDTGMELLVNKKIISLDLPVKEVYKKIWAPEHGEGEPMPIIYRMRGLLGDATEDMVNSLDNSTEEDVDKEEVYKMASVLRDCGGLHVMLQRLYAINDLVLGRQVMAVLLKLFSYAVNVKANRQELIKPRLNTVAIMLRALNIALLAEQEGSGALSGGQGQTITEQILQIMEVILMEASSQDPEQYKEFSRHFCDKDQLMMLLERINSPFVRGNPTVLQALMRLIPFLAFGEEEMMSTLVNHFLPYLDFNKFDREHTQDEQVHLDCFCVIANGIEGNANGHRLKDMILDRGIVKVALDYIRQHAPPVKTLLATDSDDWKEFVSKSALRFVLRLLTGLGSGHSKTQELIGADCLSVLHKLEQVSSDEHVGTLAENLLEALKHNKAVTAKIEEIRQQTKAEKKRLAMAMRKKQLGELGMTTNEKGQVTVTSAVLKQMEDLKEETGLTCCICREGYRNQPQKVLGIYTFTKRLPLEEFENKQRKTQGYSTVSHFNLVHIDCHMAAVRHARGREEWESAALQNANTKCNGLLPLWGPQVHESAFATSLARHNTYLQECTGVRDASYTFTVHDLKNLAWRFAEERSFSEDSGGGGPQSNVFLLPYLAHMALYVINTTRTGPREEKNVMTFLESAKEKWLENCFEVESPMYFTALSILVIPPDKWQGIRVKLLSRLLLQAHARKVCQAGAKTLTDKEVKDYNVYRRMLIFFGLLNTFYEKSLKKVAIPADSSWPQALADHIRNSDRQLTEAGDRVLSVYQDELLPCESFSEFCDVTGLLEEISNPDGFMGELLTSVP